MVKGWKTSSKVYITDEDKTVDLKDLTKKEWNDLTQTWVKKSFEILGYKVIHMD